MDINSKIYIAGHKGLVGSSLMRLLNAQGYHNLVTRTHGELDLTEQKKVQTFFNLEKPEYVILAAAKVGGINANSQYPGEFIYQNISIQTNVIQYAYQTNVKRLLFLGSSCIYPRDCPQPIKEDYLMTAPLEETNRAYATAKIAGIEMCASYNRQFGTKFLAVMPTNLFGPNDNFDLHSSHVLPALLRKMHEAKEQNKKSVSIWGTGKAKREFLYSDDLAKALLFLLNLSNDTYDNLLSRAYPIINVGTGVDLTIFDLCQEIANFIQFSGTFEFDNSKPDGTPRKLLDTSLINQLGWKPEVTLQKGLKEVYQNFLNNLIKSNESSHIEA